MNKTRKKYEIIKSMDTPYIDYTLTLENLKTQALMYGDYELAAEIRLEQLKNKKTK